MSLTVLNVAYPLAPVGPDAVGGAEQILSQLDAALIDAGHGSIVIACEGSTARGVLVETPRPSGRLDDAVRQQAHQATRCAIERTLAEHSVDLVHLHGVDFDQYLPEPGVPVLVTLHLPAHFYAPSAWRSLRPATFLQGVSRTQHATLEGLAGPLLDPIPNGVPLDELRPSTHREDFAVALGRVCPEKGFHLAAEAARSAGLPLIVAGQVFPYATHQEYFLSVVVPLINQAVMEFIGPVGMPDKRRLLARARCLLVPSQTPETSSLVAMEALACGTPVIAFRAGALGEIVDHGRTGYLVDSVEAMAEAIARLDRIDPAECRRVAEQRFSSATMTTRYLERYEHIVRSARARVTIEVVSTIGGLEGIREEWAALWTRTRTPSVFQHPDWLIPWCRPFHVQQPWLLALRRGGRLVGIAPLLVYPRGGERVLTLMGAGVSDDQGFVIEPGAEAAVLSAIWSYLCDHPDRFDVFELENLPADSILLTFAPGARRGDVRPVLNLPEAARGLDDVLPTGMVKRLRHSHNRVHREGLEVRFETATPPTFDRLFDGLVRLHRARWAEQGMLPPRLESFHREVARRCLDRGLLRLHALRLGDRLAAVFYGYHAGGRTVYYLSGFDPALDRFSPGNLVVAHAIEHALRHDHAHAFDFLRGREAYKYAWGAVDEPIFSASVQPWDRKVVADAG